jgi:hypothetical protein
MTDDKLPVEEAPEGICHLSSVIVRASGEDLPGRPMHRAAAQQMDMEMWHGLAAVATAIDH